MKLRLASAWILVLILLPLSVSAADAPAAPAVKAKPFYLEPATLGSWWYAGQTVTYRSGGGPAPEELTGVLGVVTNSAGDKVAEAQATRAEIESKGWTWTPPEPGFYEVEFQYLTAAGAKKEIARYFELKAPGASEKQAFKRTRQGFAVLPTPSKAPEKAIGQFGLANDHPTAEDVQLAKFIGFDLVRLTVPWGAMFTNLSAAIEPVKGEYKWERMDQNVDFYTKAGFVINAQFLYTPVWASPHPEKVDKINICVREANAYAPTDLNDFSNFVTLTVNRYKDRVRLWEIWNEPSVPGGSVFWSDTTENFVAMLKAGSTAVKKAQPDAEVWLGGLGPRAPYHAFYNRILQLGAGPYFDVLSLHGSFNAPSDKFRSIEKINNVAPKPAIQGEWHAILQGNAQSAAPLSEQALSLKMMKDMLYQVKNGVNRLIFFELKNLVEKETLDYAAKNKWFVHSSGLFRVKPQLEPRQPAVVLANFLDLAGRKVKFTKELAMGDNVIAVALETGNGPVVAFWGEGVPPSLEAAKTWVSATSQIRDWEGKPIAKDAKVRLEENRLYYILNANVDAITKAATADNLVSPRAKIRSAANASKGSWMKGTLFATVDATPQVPEAAWLKKDWKFTPLLKVPQDASFSARAAVAAGDAGLDIVVEVKDKTHAQKEPTPAFWNGDSLQMAIDCEGVGITGGNTEFVCALTESGPMVWKILAADPRGDIPQKWSTANSEAKFVEKRFVREGDTTRYQLRIPWSEVFPMTFDTTRPLRISFAVNNNNGSGRQGYLEWGGGITDDKDPSLYGVLQFAPELK